MDNAWPRMLQNILRSSRTIALSPNVRQMAKKANAKTFLFSWPLPSLWNRNIISQWRKLKDTITEIEGTQIIERIDYFEKTTKITLVMFPSSKWLLVGGCIRGDFSNLCKTVQKSIFMTLIIGKGRRWAGSVAHKYNRWLSMNVFITMYPYIHCH